MTTQQTPPTPWETQPQWQQPMDPRAAAKAQRAYAKATRPWYKKKRFIAPIALVAIVGISVSTNGGSDSSTNASTTSTGSTDTGSNKATGDSGKPAKADKAEPGSRNNPVRIGQTVSLEGTKYTVKQAHTSAALGSQFMRERADGVFVVVTLTIENTKDETKTFSDAAAKFVTKDGNSYSTDVDGTVAVMGNNEEPLWLSDMQPDLPKTGKLVFDVPPAKVKGGSLEVSDLFGGGEAYIALGQK